MTERYLDASANEPTEKRWTLAQLSWTLADAARDPYISLVTAFIFPAYFVNHLVGDPIEGQALWGLAMGVSMFGVAILAPLLGAVADQMGSRKPWIVMLLIVGSGSMLALWYAEPGQSGVVMLVMVLASIAMIADELSLVFTNAMLPTLAHSSQFGRLSGIGWAIGFGSSVFMLLFFQQSSWLDFEFDNFELERFSTILAGIWYAVFLAPILVFANDIPNTGVRLPRAFMAGSASILRTFLAVGSFRNVLLFLVANGLAAGTAISFMFFAGIYAAEVFSWGTETLGLLGFEMIIGAAIFAIVGGMMDDHIGGKKNLMIAIGSSLLIYALMATITSSSIGPINFISEPNKSFGLFGSPPEQIYHLLNFLQGGAMGMIMTSGRSLLSRISAPSMLGEFYGLDKMGRAIASFFAPLLISFLTVVFQSQRLGIFSVMLCMSALSFFFIYFVVEERSESLL